MIVVMNDEKQGLIYLFSTRKKSSDCNLYSDDGGFYLLQYNADLHLCLTSNLNHLRSTMIRAVYSLLFCNAYP